MSKDKPGSQYKDTINLPNTAFPMKAGLPQREPKILKKWQELDVYHELQKQRADAPTYILHDGPPYANGNIHIGHAVNKILKDIIVKSRNLAGYRTPYIQVGIAMVYQLKFRLRRNTAKQGTKLIKKPFVKSVENMRTVK